MLLVLSETVVMVTNWLLTDDHLMPFEFYSVLDSLYQYSDYCSTIVTSGMQAIVGRAWAHAHNIMTTCMHISIIGLWLSSSCNWAQATPYITCKEYTHSRGTWIRLAATQYYSRRSVHQLHTCSILSRFMVSTLITIFLSFEEYGFSTY